MILPHITINRPLPVDIAWLWVSKEVLHRLIFLMRCHLCLDWCFDKIEPTRFGDKISRSLEQKFQNNVEGSIKKIQAPWNAIRYPYSEAECIISMVLDI